MKTTPFLSLAIVCLLMLKWNVSIGQNQNLSNNLLDEYYQATNTNIAIEDREVAAKKMLFLLKKNPVDSLISKTYLLLCKLNSKQEKWDSAYYYSEKIIDYASSKKNTSLLVQGYFRKGYYQEKRFKNLEAFDAYSKGVSYATSLGDSIPASNMLSNLADIQNDIGDFYGAQSSATKGLKYITKENKNSEYLLNNKLAIAFSNCKDYKNAEEVYTKNLTIAKSPIKKARTLNNLANNYRKQRQFENAINTFKKAFKDSTSISNTTTLARLKDNYGYTLFQWEGNQGLDLMLKALKTRKRLDDYEGQFASNIHLINYYFQKDQNKSLQFATQALLVAQKVKSPDMRSEALSYLIKLNPTKGNTIAYVTLNDSITTAKQLTQNKYAGILFKTEEKEKHNLQLQQENTAKQLQLEKENLRKWIFGLGLLLVVIISFFIWKKYKAEEKAKKTITIQKDEIEAQKNTVEELQRELHHRLKNNLSVIDFFITLAKGKFKNKEYQDKLSELQNRINSMFAIHTQLLKKEDITSVNAKFYIESLTQSIQKVYDNSNISMTHLIDENEKLGTKLSFPIGLIINEFVTNSYKYAFPKNMEGKISIKLHSDQENYYLEASDNGIGLPKDFNIETLTSFGIDTIKLLTEEYHGKFQLNGSQGVQLNIILPKQTN